MWYLYEKICLFWRNLHHWQKFYTAAWSGRSDKYHLWSKASGDLQGRSFEKKTGPTVANQISVGEKMSWGRQWKRKIGYKSIFTAKLPAFWPPAWGLINFQCIQNISEQAIFFFSVSQNAQELSWCNFADWMIVWDPCQNCYCQIWPKFKS